MNESIIKQFVDRAAKTKEDRCAKHKFIDFEKFVHGRQVKRIEFLSDGEVVNREFIRDI